MGKRVVGGIVMLSVAACCLDVMAQPAGAPGGGAGTPQPPAHAASAGHSEPVHIQKDKPPAITAVDVARTSGIVSKEFMLAGAEVIDTRRGLVFSRCPYGQKWQDRLCKGNPDELTRKDVFNPRTKAALGKWRVPTVDELGAVMGYFIRSKESPFKPGVKYWTSTKAANDKGYQLLHYGVKPVGLAKPTTQLTTSSEVPAGFLIMVRKQAG